MFLGRTKELQILDRLMNLKKASFVVCRGRRRIGKSTLIEEFGKKYRHFYEFQGLAPRKGITNQSQLDNFSRLLKDQFDLPDFTFKNWTEAFSLLAKQTEKEKALILLDEISWMAASDSDFVGQLKIAWDTKFKKNNNLILVVCGSVTSWLDQNILNSSDFMGRVSATITLEELPLNLCNEFWGKKKTLVSSYEKFKLLSITGGIPRYLEEINFNDTAENNISKMCFADDGILFHEFDKVFNDIFLKRATNYKQIIKTLVSGKLSFVDICEKLKLKPNGVLTNYLSDLELSGLITRDYVYHLNGKKSKLSQYRLKDNYLRFYLKYIEPNKEKIKENLFTFKSLENLTGWETILGFQFENLVLNHKNIIHDILEIPADAVVSSSPYFQYQTQRTAACQIDWLIQTKNTLYICEIKFRKKIGTEVIKEMVDKAKKLKYPKHYSIRPVLIYEGALAPSLTHDDYLYRMINFGNLLQT
jgi:AAA+ ATPase superfamily predicted ATPase